MKMNRKYTNKTNQQNIRSLKIIKQNSSIKNIHIKRNDKTESYKLGKKTWNDRKLKRSLKLNIHTHNCSKWCINKSIILDYRTFRKTKWSANSSEEVIVYMGELTLPSVALDSLVYCCFACPSCLRLFLETALLLAPEKK